MYQHGLQAIPQQDLASRMQRVPIEHFQWPLGLAIFLLFMEPLISNRRSSTTRTASRSALSATSQVVPWIVLVLVLSNSTIAQAAPGDKALKQGDFETAIEQIIEHLADNPHDFRMHYNLGVAHYQRGDYAAAVEAWELSLGTADPEHQHDAFYNLGNAYFRRGQLALAEAKKDLTFFEIFSQTPTLVQEAGQAAKDALSQNDLAARKTSWEQCEAIVDQIKEGIQQAQTFKESSQTSIEHWRNALHYYTSAKALQPEDEDVHFNYELVDTLQTTLLEQNEAMQGTIEDQKVLQEQLQTLIAALKAPTPMVIEAEKVAQMLIERGQYAQAYALFSQTAQQDPTAEKFQDKQTRTGEIVGILTQEQSK